jgi:hypothetical protein
MAIPDIEKSGLLPFGVHDCSLQEIGARFGIFHETDRRTRLFEKLEAYVEEVRRSGVAATLIVDGSFVTADENPGDIDLVLVLTETHDFTADLAPMQYNVLSHRRVRARYGFDVFVARQDSTEYHEYVEFFQQVRGTPPLRKGVLRLRI